MKTTIDTKKENSDILIENANGGSFTINNKNNVEIKGRGIKEIFENGFIEVTENKLNQLRKLYKVECNF